MTATKPDINTNLKLPSLTEADINLPIKLPSLTGHDINTNKVNYVEIMFNQVVELVNAIFEI